MREYLPESIRKKVAKRARYRCEYCRFPDEHSFLPFQIDHIIAIKHLGGNEIENLAWACPHCNQFKGSDLSTYLAEIDQIVPLYHPRKETWRNHFEVEDGAIIGLTKVGKATVQLLQLNLVILKK
ncbi:MAG: HNH endonuclease signature motif containing protein [Bacteroidota bacterium]